VMVLVWTVPFNAAYAGATHTVSGAMQ
jgi:hypothetical protein